MSGSWFNGDGTPDTSGLGEDPIKVAAQEMAATVAVHAMQKAQLASSGVGLAMGGAPSPESIAAWGRTGEQPKDVNPYAHLSRDEKIALLGQLQKSRAEQKATQSTPDENLDLVDPVDYLSKGGSKGTAHPPPAAPPKTMPHEDPAKKPDMTKGGGVPGKVEKAEDEEEKDPKKQLQKSMDALQSVSETDEEFFDRLHKSHEGEGTRGGKVIGHTPSGVPIYSPSDDHIARVREHVNLQKKTAKSKLDEHAAAHVSHDKNYSADDHKHAADAHKRESTNFKNSDKVRAFHGAIADAHAAKAEGKPTPHAAAEAKRNKAYEQKEVREKKKEASRKKVEVATAPGGHKIMNTHHVRNSGFGGPSGPHEGSGESARHGKAFGVSHEPIETEAGEHLTHDQHKDIAAYHHEQAHHHEVHSKVGNDFSAKIDHRDKSAQHEHAAKYHETEAKKKAPKADPNQGELFKKSSSSPDLDDFIRKSEAHSAAGENTMESASAILDEFLSKSEGQGGMPATGNPPSEMPMSRREVDGGEVAEAGKASGAQSPPANTAASTSGGSPSPSDDLQKKTPKDKDLECDAPGQALQKGQLIDWNQAADDGERIRAQLVSQLMNKSMDVEIGIGVKLEKSAPVQNPVEMPSIYFQKGGAYVYVDSEDRRIEKAMANVGGQLCFSQGSQANFGAPIQHERECYNCHSLVKSFLASCTDCGVQFHGTAPEVQGLRLEKSVAASLIQTDEDDILIG